MGERKEQVYRYRDVLTGMVEGGREWREIAVERRGEGGVGREMEGGDVCALPCQGAARSLVSGCAFPGQGALSRVRCVYLWVVAGGRQEHPALPNG